MSFESTSTILFIVVPEKSMMNRPMSETVEDRLCQNIAESEVEDHKSKGQPKTNDQADKNLDGRKRRSWRKPKDKPKRSLTSYNIFFQYERARIVAGRPAQEKPEDIMCAVEEILNKKTQVKRRHRKSHGRIGFKDLARTVADRWKILDPQTKAIFVYYANIDTHRYRAEVKIWREKTEAGENVTSEDSDLSGSSSPAELSESNSFTNLSDLFKEKLPDNENLGFDVTFSNLQMNDSPTLEDQQRQHFRYLDQHHGHQEQQQQLLLPLQQLDGSNNLCKTAHIGHSGQPEFNDVSTSSFGSNCEDGTIDMTNARDNLLQMEMLSNQSAREYYYSKSFTTSMPVQASAFMNHSNNPSFHTSMAANQGCTNMFSSIEINTTDQHHHHHQEQLSTLFHPLEGTNDINSNLEAIRHHEDSLDSGTWDLSIEGDIFLPQGNRNFSTS